MLAALQGSVIQLDGRPLQVTIVTWHAASILNLSLSLIRSPSRCPSLRTDHPLQEAIASRRSQLVDKAQQRAAEREAERRKLAEQLRELQFRETCDALRSKQSQQRLVGVAEQQKQQVRSLGFNTVHRGRTW